MDGVLWLVVAYEINQIEEERDVGCVEALHKAATERDMILLPGARYLEKYTNHGYITTRLWALAIKPEKVYN